MPTLNYILSFRRQEKKLLATYVHTYDLPRFIIGTMVKEKFDHKQ